MAFFSIVSYVLVFISVTGFALYAFIRSLFHRKERGGTEEFITARGQVKMWRVAWSFYAGSIGAWVVVAPPQYAVVGGVIGMVMYSLCSGIPILLIALCGQSIQEKFPHVLSLGDYAGYRFGRATQIYVVLLTVFNMAIALLVEFTTIGALVSAFLGMPEIPLVVTVGVLTMLYTAAGGLYISIVTDQVQGIASVILTLFLSCYVAFSFRKPLSPQLPPQLGPNYVGYSSLLSMPASLITSTIFSESMWQRVWASESRRVLNQGAIIGSIGVILVVFFTSFCGFLAFWAGTITPETNENLYFFTLLARDTNTGQLRVDSWAGVSSMILAATMNESAIDSFQNGLVASIGGFILKDKNVNYARVCVFLVNIPAILLSTLDFNVLQLFLVTNMLSSTSAIPILLGLVQGNLKRYIKEYTVLGACLFSIFSVCAYGIIQKGSFREGMYIAWVGNNYDWKYFLIAIVSSAVFPLVCIASLMLINTFTKHNQPYKRQNGEEKIDASLLSESVDKQTSVI